MSDINKYKENYKAAAKEMTEAIKSGVTEGLSGLEEAAEQKLDSTLDATKKYNKEAERLAEERKRREEEYDRLVYRNSLNSARTAAKRQQLIAKENLRQKELADEEYLEELKRLAEEEERIREEQFTKLEYRLKLGEISEAEYYSQLAELRDIYFEEGSAEWEMYTFKIGMYAKSLVDEQAAALEKLTAALSKEIEKQKSILDTKQAQISDKLSDYGGTLHKTNKIITGNGTFSYPSLNGVSMDLRALSEYNDVLISAKARIDSILSTDTGDAALDEKNAELREKLFDEMRSLSVEEGTDFASLLTFADENTFKRYISEWSQKQELADEIAANLMSADRSSAAAEQAARVGEIMSDAMSQSFGSVSEEFFRTGELACTQFGDGFIASLATVFEEMHSRLSEAIGSFGAEYTIGDAAAGVQNYTSYNVYGDSVSTETLRQLRQREIFERMMLGD